MQRALQKDVDDEWILGCTCDHQPCRVCKRGSCYVLLGVMPAGERGGDSLIVVFTWTCMPTAEVSRGQGFVLSLVLFW